jgi:polyhydroxybutyrate depolymerase
MTASQRRWLVVGSLTVAVALIAAACAQLPRRSQISGATSAPASPGSVGKYTPGDYVEDILVQGQTRQYRLHIPPGYQPGRPMPLVLNFHGLNSNAAQQEQVSQMSARADQAGFVVAYPEGLGNPQVWHVGPRAEGASDLQFVRDMIRYVQGQLSIDPARIYATGISNGSDGQSPGLRTV